MKRNRRGWLYLLFVVSILGITLGYSYLNTELQINGTTNITSASWDIYWNNVQLGSNNVTTVTTPATISTGKTEVTFNVNFKEPGDTYEFTVDAVNDGTIDGMISTFSKGVYAANGTTPKNLPDYLEYTVTYSSGAEIAENQLLESGKTETYKVRVHYKEDITATQLPSTDDNYMFKFSVTYVQADNNAQAIHHPLNGIYYTVNQYDSNVTGNNQVFLNQPFPADITLYQTPSEALSAMATLSSKNLQFYLKHKIENDIVTESYVEFVVTPEMAGANPGMTAGTYTLRGEKTYDSSTSTWLIDENYVSPYYEANKEAIKSAFGISNCFDMENEVGTGFYKSFRCGIIGLGAESRPSGFVNGFESTSVGGTYDPPISRCFVGTNGASYCLRLH